MPEVELPRPFSPIIHILVLHNRIQHCNTFGVMQCAFSQRTEYQPVRGVFKHKTKRLLRKWQERSIFSRFCGAVSQTACRQQTGMRQPSYTSCHWALTPLSRRPRTHQGPIYESSAYGACNFHFIALPLRGQEQEYVFPVLCTRVLCDALLIL